MMTAVTGDLGPGGGAACLREYRQRILEQTEFVDLTGIPLPKDRAGKRREMCMPLDRLYIRVQAVEEKQQRAQEEAEVRTLQQKAVGQAAGERRRKRE